MGGLRPVACGVRVRQLGGLWWAPLLQSQSSRWEAGHVVGSGAATDRFHVCVFLQHLSIKGNII